MNYNPTIKTTNWFVQDNMFLEQNHNWNKKGDCGAGDAIGRTTRGYFTYEDPKLIEGIKNCWKRNEFIDDDGNLWSKCEYVGKANETE